MMSKVNEAILILSGWIELSITAKATIMLVLGLVLVWFFRNARASIRHFLSVATFAALFLLPLMVALLPERTIDVLVNYSDNSITELNNISASENTTTNTSGYFGKTLDDSSWSVLSLTTIIRLGWSIGVFLLFTSLIINLWRLHRLRRNGVPWFERHDYMKSLASECGIRRTVEILLHEDIKVPFTCGVWRQAIILPSDARQWNEADLRRVLLHELEHIKRSDWVIQLAARVVCALYWFHPLVWMIWRRLCLEAERACDDAVIQRAESIEYADQLVRLAQRLSKPSALPTVSVANRSDLSLRISAILDERQRRGRTGLPAVASTTLAAVFLVLAIAPLRAVMQSSVIQSSSSVSAEVQVNSLEDNSINYSEVKISKDGDRRRNFYERKGNNSNNIKLSSVGGDESQTGGASEKQMEKLPAGREAEKFQSEKQPAEMKDVKAEGIGKQDNDAERRKRWAEMEEKRLKDEEQRKIDTEKRKHWAEIEEKRLMDDLEQRKRQSQIQAMKDQAFARQAGIIPK